MYKRKKYLVVGSPKDVYAGHGSFIILTKYYLSKVGIVNYPVFLFCEEIYLAEMCRINNLLVRYEPSSISRLSLFMFFFIFLYSFK